MRVVFIFLQYNIMIIFEPICRNAEDVAKMPMRTRSGLVVDPRYSYVQPDNPILFSKHTHSKIKVC